MASIHEHRHRLLRVGRRERRSSRPSSARSLAARGHRVHILSSDTPVRLGDYQPGLSFHRVETPSYPLFREPQYLLSLAEQDRAGVARRASRHRARALRDSARDRRVPGAADSRRRRGSGAVPRVITTLHGTDITLLGSDPSYSETVAFCIEQSDGVTAVSESLQGGHESRARASTREIRVIPNFVDCTANRRREVGALRARLAPRRREAADSRVQLPAGEAGDGRRRGVRARARARARPAADGRRRSRPRRRARGSRARSASPTTCDFLGEQDQVVPLLSAADVFLLPSAQESFGLAALEAMACEVPVVASRVGGLPEVIQDGVNGFLHEPDDLDGMAHSHAAAPDRRRRCTGAPRRQHARRAEGRFCDSKIVPLYEAYYEEVLAGNDQRRTRAECAYETSLLVVAACARVGLAVPRAQMRVVPVDEEQGHVALGLALRHLGNTGIFMKATAHPDDENNGLLVMLNRGQGYPHGARDGDARQRRPERDRPRDLRGARRPAHRGARRAAPLRRRRAVLHARGRLRLLVQRRGDLREVGPRRDHRRLRPADPDDPARRDPRPARRTAPAAASTIRRRRSSRATPSSSPAIRRSIPSRSKEGLRPWQPRKFYFAGRFGGPGEQTQAAKTAGDQPRRVRSAARQDLLRDRHRSAQHAQVPGHGAAARACRARRRDSYPARRVDDRRAAGARRDDRSSTASTPRSPASRSSPAPDRRETWWTDSPRSRRPCRTRSSGSTPKAHGATLQPLLTGLRAVRALRAPASRPWRSTRAGASSIDFRLRQKEREFQQAILLANGVRVEALADDGVVVPGQPVQVSVRGRQPRRGRRDRQAGEVRRVRRPTRRAR